LADNLAPQSFFNAVGYDPLRVIFAGDMKDSIRNVEDSGVLAISVYLKPKSSPPRRSRNSANIRMDRASAFRP